MKAPCWTLVLAWLVLATTGARADAPVKIVALGHSAFADKSGPSPTDYPEQLHNEGLAGRPVIHQDSGVVFQ